MVKVSYPNGIKIDESLPASPRNQRHGKKAVAELVYSRVNARCLSFFIVCRCVDGSSNQACSALAGNGGSLKVHNIRICYRSRRYVAEESAVRPNIR